MNKGILILLISAISLSTFHCGSNPFTKDAAIQVRLKKKLM